MRGTDVTPRGEGGSRFRTRDRPVSAEELKAAASSVRRKILLMLFEAKSGHPGGSLSAADVMTAIYLHKMRHDPKNPKWADRDRFLLSKGHGAPALYAVLAECGYISDDELKTLRKLGSRLQGHADPLIPGVEIPSGALGIGLSEGVGMALALKLDRKDSIVYVLLGDGEINEGEVWEAAMSAAKFRLGNLVAIVDKNNLQQSGATAKVMPVDPLPDKWASFNWNVTEIDGHDMDQIKSALASAGKNGMPTVIIANTVKGKGVDYMEGKAEYHSKIPDKAALENALGQLTKK